MAAFRWHSDPDPELSRQHSTERLAAVRNPEFAISSHKAHRWPFEREVEKKLPTRPGFYRNKDKTSVYYLDSCGVWKLIAYMGPDFDLQMKDPWDSLLVPVFDGEVVSERRVRNDMPLHYYKLGLKQPKEDKENS